VATVPKVEGMYLAGKVVRLNDLDDSLPFPTEESVVVKLVETIDYIGRFDVFHSFESGGVLLRFDFKDKEVVT
jgi:hypothetical protein